MALRVSLLLGSLLLLLLLMLPHTTLSKPSEIKGEKRSLEHPFKFLQNLEGSQKGQTVEGLNELKKYLKKFGYLNYGGNSNDVKLAGHANNDEFDELLESAIKTYQINYKLKATGSLDSQTVKQMMIPRCGVADITTNGTTSMRSGKKKHHQDLHTVSHYKFYRGRPRWPRSKTHFTYSFRSSVALSEAMEEDLRRISEQAFEKWAKPSLFTFEEVDSSSDIVIGFHRLSHGDDDAFDGQGGVTSHAYEPTSGKIHLDADEYWGTSGRPGVMDLESIAVHGIGHVLGLDHSPDQDTVMYPFISPGVTKRRLSDDDILGIRTLYGRF
ncbi:hypothetical protein HHK36_031920 [Tetracentron sinense]|uniref:Peptidase metallopeptidase domain-containing protein n=1 Tax=Tetracentron sinense TaxID=13715 RepID=A0A834YBM6_TETSI|nr:hypothetical protein HHK36_031920 [Tetracentron sinense]